MPHKAVLRILSLSIRAQSLGQVHLSIVTFHPNDISPPPVFDISRVLKISLTSAPGPDRKKTAAPGGPVPGDSDRSLALGKDSCFVPKNTARYLSQRRRTPACSVHINKPACGLYTKRAGEHHSKPEHKPPPSHYFP